MLTKRIYRREFKEKNSFGRKVYVPYLVTDYTFCGILVFRNRQQLVTA